VGELSCEGSMGARSIFMYGAVEVFCSTAEKNFVELAAFYRRTGSRNDFRLYCRMKIDSSLEIFDVTVLGCSMERFT
jgi:hypothetical protein